MYWHYFSPLQFVFFTGGIVFLTLIVNGSTTQFVLHLLDMDKLSAAKVRMLLVFRTSHSICFLLLDGVLGCNDGISISFLKYLMEHVYKSAFLYLKNIDVEPTDVIEKCLQ